MTLDELLETVEDIPYYNNVVDDYDAEDYSWEVTQKVLEYANNFSHNPSEIFKIPPILVVDGKLKDGAHRISAVYLLRERLPKSNPFWHSFWYTVKLKVEFKTGEI
jgi:hypothetical protein